MKDPIKVYDARWEVNEFNDKEIERLFEATLAYAKLCDIDTITLTRDARLGCARIMEIGMKTALRLGFRVFICTDPISTPLSYFTTLKTTLTYPGTMGLTITASHNPMQYIGIKFTMPTVQAIGLNCGPLGGLTKIKEIYHSNQKFNDIANGELNIMDHPTGEYINFSMKAADVKKSELNGLTVVIDTLNGSAGPELFKALSIAGVKTIPLKLVPNGYFPAGSPNPTSKNKMNQALEIANKYNANVVIGVDGDGDRIVFGDRKGIFSAGFVTIPILKTLLAGQKFSQNPKILYDPKMNPLALAEWRELNVTPILFRNGHSQIKDYMHKISALAAAEESGHYYHKIKMGNLEIAGENSLLTILLFLAAVKNQPNLMRELREKEDQVFTTGEFNYQFSSDNIRDDAMNAVIENFRVDGADIRTETDDGIDLQGVCVNKGINLEVENESLEKKWYSGYFRIATNEKGVVRSYLSTGDFLFGKELEKQARNILQDKFDGKVID